MSDKMIPFGKYKGQPIEVLQNDPQYAEWIAQQQWAKERYPSIVNIIINKFGENEETPDHNAMQAKFMAKGYCAAAYLTLGGFQPKLIQSPTFKSYELEKQYFLDGSAGDLLLEDFKKLSDLVSGVEFEKDAVDVQFYINGIRVELWEVRATDPTPRLNKVTREFEVVKGGHPRIELKPAIGDDYPAVLRQMRNNGSNALVYGEYTGVGVPEQTFRAFFATQGIRVCAEKEISDRIIERAEEKISEIKNAIAEQEKILRSRVTVS